MSTDVLLTFDNLGEAYDLYRFDHAGGAVADGVYAVRRGVPRILEFLDDMNIQATFFVEGWNARKYPSLVREIASAGHEVASHGWLHEQWNELNESQEFELIERTTQTIGEITGSSPVGWRSPWARTTPQTLNLLESMGYLYDSSFADEDVPYRFVLDATSSQSLIELPFSQALNDTPFYSFPGVLHSPEHVASIWWDELSGLAKEASFAVVTVHPRFSGRPARFQAFRSLVERLTNGELGEVNFMRSDHAAEAYAQWTDLPDYPAPEVLERLQ